MDQFFLYYLEPQNSKIMVGRQMIVSPVFKARGKLSVSMMRNLLVRGGGIQVSDTLQRFGWGGEEPVVATVVTLEPDSGRIRGLRYVTKGKGPEIKFKAKELWPNISEDITVKIKLTDLAIINWSTEGEKRNQSEWLDGRDLDIEVLHHERGQLSEEDFQELGGGGLSMRFTLLPVQQDKMFLYGGLVPLSIDELMEKLRGMEMEPSSPCVPTIAMKLHFSKGKLQNALPVDLMPTERLDDKVGLGVFPLLESVGLGMSSTKFPEHGDLGFQLSRFLRQNNPTNNVKLGRMQSLLTSNSFPLATTGTIPFEWPEYVRQATASETMGSEPNTGMSVLVFLLSAIKVGRKPSS